MNISMTMMIIIIMIIITIIIIIIIIVVTMDHIDTARSTLTQQGHCAVTKGHRVPAKRHKVRTERHELRTKGQKSAPAGRTRYIFRILGGWGVLLASPGGAGRWSAPTTHPMVMTSTAARGGGAALPAGRVFKSPDALYSSVPAFVLFLCFHAPEGIVMVLVMMMIMMLIINQSGLLRPPRAFPPSSSF